MPRNASGVFTLPVTSYVSGTVIRSADMNSNLSDIASALTLSLATNGVSSMSAPIKGANGTVTLPGYSFASSTDTGFYLVSSGVIGVSNSGTQTMTFNADNTVTFAKGATFGTGTITTGANGTVNIGATTAFTFGASNTITTSTGSTHTFNSGSTLTIASGATFSATLGAGSTVTFASGSAFTISAGSTVSITTAGATVVASGGSLTLNAGSTLALSNTTFTFGAGSADALITALALKFTLQFSIDGGGSVPSTGSKGFIEVPCDCTITRWTIMADQSGSAVVDVNKSTYGAFPPTGSIAGTAKPTLTAAQKNQTSTLTGWTTTWTAGDILGFDLDSVSTCTRINVSLFCTKTGL